MKELLSLLPRPSHYIGTEEGSVHKEPASVRLHCALAFPDLYEVGMSYLGHKILYTILNNREDIFAERVYAPCRETGRLLREHGVSLATLESDTDIVKTHMFAFAITHELCFTNVLYMLELSGIPLRAADRGDDLFRWPLIVAGGGCAIASEPLAPFMDLMLLGEGEEMVPELCDLVIKAREEGWSRSRLIEEAVNIPGVYAPSLYTHDANGVLTPLKPDLPTPGRRIVADFDRAAYPEKQVVPFGAVHNRLSLEIARGCTRGCRFCQAGMIYRPVREKNVERLKDLAYKMLKNTGHEEISLSSLSSSDYRSLEELVRFLIEEFHGKGVNVSLPSLRIDAFSLDVMSKVQDVKKSSLTFAPEAGSQRLRDVINKGLTEEEILQGAADAFKGGWNRVKLYFMLGLPTETVEDMEGIALLSEKIAEEYYEIPKDQRNGKVQVVASTSFFVPKPFTPFQWARMSTKEEFLDKARVVNRKMKEMLNHKSLKYNWHEADVTVLEGVLARGDRRVAAVIEEAYRNGALYDAWSESFRNDIWMKAFETCGVDIDFYTTRERSLDELFPWDFIDTGVSKEFLKREWNNAVNGTVTPNCRERCSGCGVRRFGGGVCFEDQD